jgi:hypothetical protein
MRPAQGLLPSTARAEQNEGSTERKTSVVEEKRTYDVGGVLRPCPELPALDQMRGDLTALGRVGVSAVDRLITTANNVAALQQSELS